MSLGLRESRTKQRRQRRARFLKWLFLLGCVTAGGVALYRAGAMVSQGQIRQLQSETSRLSSAVTEVEKRNLDLMASTEQAKLSAQEWQRRYEQDVPKGPTQRLYGLIVRQLEAGADEYRLAFLIDAASEDRSCANTPTTKRFLVTTPIPGGTDPSARSVSFADNAITVVGEGEPAVNAAGQSEAWFDPAKPVTLLFSRLGGETSRVTAKLPLHHSIVLGNQEYRFTATASDSRGFINVTADRCAFP